MHVFKSTFILYVDELLLNDLGSARFMIVYKAPDLQVKYHSKQNQFRAIDRYQNINESFKFRMHDGSKDDEQDPGIFIGFLFGQQITTKIHQKPIVVMDQT